MVGQVMATGSYAGFFFRFTFTLFLLRRFLLSRFRRYCFTDFRWRTNCIAALARTRTVKKSGVNEYEDTSPGAVKWHKGK